MSITPKAQTVLSILQEQSLLLEKIGHILDEGIGRAYDQFDTPNHEGTESFFVCEEAIAECLSLLGLLDDDDNF